MPNKLANRVKVTVSGTPGTGTITLGSAVSGFMDFATAGVSNGNTVPYVIEDSNNWEIGVGTYTSSGTTLARTSITASSNSGSAISVTSSAIVMISPLAADLQAGTSAGNLVQLDGMGKLPAVDGSQLTGINTSAGGTSGQIQYNNAGSFGGFTVSGDGTLNTSTGALTVTKTSGTSFGALATTTPGTGVATALGVNTGSAGAFVVNGGALGTPSSGTLTNATGLPIVAGTTGTLTAARGGTGLTSLGTGVSTALGNNTNGASGLVVLDASTKLPAVDGSQLTGISAGATGGSTDRIFWNNDQSVTANYTVPASTNAGTFGPISINSGITVTISSGSNWIVI